MKKYTQHGLLWLLLLATLLLYLCFPTSNSSIDAYGFAASVKYSEELLHPHHLLYNVQGYGLYKIYSAIFKETDALQFLISLNGIYAFLVILVLLLLLREIGVSAEKLPLLLMIAAFSFGTWRFATENETYILPILLSLAGSLFWIKGYRNRKWPLFLISGLFAATACLFHQLQIFWWLGLLAGCFFLKNPGTWKRIAAYAAPALLIPVAYILAIRHLGLPLSIEQIWRFIVFEYAEGNATTTIGFKSMLLTPISLFRTFYQVHGYVFQMLMQQKVYWIPAILSGILALVGIFLILKQKWLVKSGFSIIWRIHLLILLLTLAFAFYSVGNAEFMAGIPVLLVVIFGCLAAIPGRGLAALAFSLLLWNFCFGTWPLHHYQMQANEMIAAYMTKAPQSVFILEDPVRPSNIMYYRHHKRNENVFRCERLQALDVRALLKKEQAGGRQVYSNCGGQPQVMSRAAIMSSSEKDDLLTGFGKTVVDSTQSFNGWHFLYKLHMPDGE